LEDIIVKNRIQAGSRSA